MAIVVRIHTYKTFECYARGQKRCRVRARLLEKAGARAGRAAGRFASTARPRLQRRRGHGGWRAAHFQKHKQVSDAKLSIRTLRSGIVSEGCDSPKFSTIVVPRTGILAVPHPGDWSPGSAIKHALAHTCRAFLGAMGVPSCWGPTYSRAWLCRTSSRCSSPCYRKCCF